MVYNVVCACVSHGIIFGNKIFSETDELKSRIFKSEFGAKLLMHDTEKICKSMQSNRLQLSKSLRSPRTELSNARRGLLIMKSSMTQNTFITQQKNDVWKFLVK